MQDVRVKICGLTREADLAAAVEAGAYAVGFVFARSPRRVTGAVAQSLAVTVPHGVVKVGLFMDPVEEAVRAVTEQVPLDLLQFHGGESNAFCKGFGLPFLKAVSMLEEDPRQVALSYPDATGILLDSHAPGGAGGTGNTFDWRRRVDCDKPLWLAGGLNPDNVAQAVRQFRPWAVDVSSGVESAPGVKNPEAMRRFIQQAKQAIHEPASNDPL